LEFQITPAIDFFGGKASKESGIFFFYNLLLHFIYFLTANLPPKVTVIRMTADRQKEHEKFYTERQITSFKRFEQSQHNRPIYH
jgi:hypothetical protein